MEKKPEYHISSAFIEGILEIVLSGKVAKSSVEELQIKIAHMIKETGATKLLVDARSLKGPRMGTLENYTAVRRPLPPIPKVNVAIVDLPDHSEKGAFLETTAFNAGHSLKFFTDFSTASAWLKKKSK